MRQRLRLYVWEDVLSDYTSGVMFALAPSLEEARRMLIETGVAAVEHAVTEPHKVYDRPFALALWGGG